MAVLSDLKFLSRALLLYIFLVFVHAPRIAWAEGERSTTEQSFLISPFPLTTHPEADLMPALSADGKWLAYVSRQNGNYDVWVRSTSGGLPSLLTTNTSDDYSPAWSPDGKSLVFVSRRDDAGGDLYLLNLHPREGGFAPGKLKRLTENFQREAFPQFSPDGKKIAFSVGMQGQEQIWLCEIKTGKSYQLTTRGGTQPAWSPSGNELAIACRTAESEEHQIFVISSDTAQADYLRRQVTFEGDSSYPTWSRDGKNVLVQRNESAASSVATAARRSRLYIIPLDFASGNLEQLSRGLQITPDSEGALFPWWGSDGAIYYAADHYGNLDIWRLPETGPIPRFNSPQTAFKNAQKLGDHETALLAYSALRYHFPDSSHWLALAGVEMGRRYLQLGEVALARKSFNNVVLYYVGNFEGAGLAELELAKLDGNVQRYEVLRQRYPNWPTVQAQCSLETGLALQKQGQAENALQIFLSLPQQFPQVREVGYRAMTHAVDILLQLERNEAAEARCVEIIMQYREQLDWRVSSVNRLLDAAPVLARTADTLAAYQRLLQKHQIPEIVLSARFRMAERLQREGESKLAENEWHSLINALASHNDDYLRNLRGEAMLRLLRLQISQNDFPAAEQFYPQIAKEYGGPPEAPASQAARRELALAALRRGRVLLRGRDFELARTVFSEARRYDPHEVEAHRGYLETMNALGQIDEAVDEYTKLVNADPRDEIALYALGLAYSYKGEHDAKTLRHSAALIEAALGMNYRLVPAYLTLGFNYEAIEKLEQKERDRKKGFFEKIAFALPGFLDNLRRTLTLRPPKLPVRWYERAIEVLTMAIALNDEKLEPQREAQLALNLANNYYNLGEFGFENAYRYYQIKMRFDSTFASPQQRAVISERIGQTGWSSGKYQEAVPYLREAIARYRLLRDVDGELRNLQRLALVYQTSGDYNTSNEYFREFINASRRENREDNIALAWRNIAYNHQKLSENDDAIERGTRSLALLAEHGSGAFPQPQKSKLMIKLLGLPVFWRTLAPTGEESSAEGLTFEQEREFVFSILEESHASRKEFEDAIAALQEKLMSFRQRKDRKGEAIALNQLGNLWYNLKDYARADEHFKRSFQICAQQNFEGGAVINLINLGNLALLRTYSGDVDIPTTIGAVDSLLQLSRAALTQIALQAPRQRLAVLNLLGNLAYYNAEHAWPEATEANSLAQSGAQRNNAHSVLSQELQRSWQALQYWAEARAAYDSALALARMQRLSREEIIVRRNLANLLALVQDFPAAFSHLQAAHELCVANNYTDLTWRIENALGTLTRFSGEQNWTEKSALDWYRHAITLLEGWPENPEDIEQRLSESNEQNELYDNAISLLAKLGEQEKSFQLEALALAERKQARHFVNLIATRYILPKKESHRLIWGGGGGDAAFLRRLLSNLRGELLKLQAEEPQRPKELARVRTALQHAEEEYQSLVRKALAEDPELASFFSVQSVNVLALRDSLPAGTALLKYFVAENEILIWLIARDRFEQVCVPFARSRLRQEIAHVRELWRTPHADNSSQAQALSALLLEPLQNLDEYTHLLIVPDDALHYLPFAALPYDEVVLAQQFTLSYATSLQALQFAAHHKSLNAENLLILQDAGTSPPVFAENLATLKTHTLAGADWRIGAASYQQVQAAGLVHLQPRFVIQPERPLDSGFVLRFTEDKRVATASLPLYRLFEADLHASVMALENTSFPYELGQTGEEMIALQRSLFYAGVPSLVVCQWEAAPEVRNTFFAQFYAGLANNSLAAAFSAAQLAARTRHPESHDWAAFELMGFPGMSDEEKNVFAQRYFRENVAKGNGAQELGEFETAVRHYRSALTMAKQLGQEEAQQRLRLLIKASAISGNDFATACEIETTLLAEALAANDAKRAAQSYQNLSIWRLRLQDYAAAENAERQFLALAERSNNALAMSSSHYRLAQIHQAANDYASAVHEAETSSAILAAQNQALPRLQVETFLGKLALENDRYNSAWNYLEPAIAAFQNARGASVLTAPEQRALAIAKQLLGVVYSRLTAYRQALKLHYAALEIFSAMADTANLSRAEQFVAETHWLNADYQQALLHQQRALKLAAPSQDEALRIRGQTALGLIWLSLGDFERSLEAQKHALQIALEWEETHEEEAQREQATIQKNLGQVYVQSGQSEQALASFRQALRLDAQLAAERGLLYDYLNLGQVFQTLAQPDSAQFQLTKAETLAVRLQDQRALAKIYFTKGMVAWNRNNRNAARLAFTEALRKAEQTHLDELQWRCLWKLGVWARQEGTLDAAWDFYQRALNRLESVSAKIKIEEYRSGFIDDKADLYEEAVLLLLQMKREAEAFMIAERAKSRSFADLLGNSGVAWQSSQGADRALLERREQLLEQINFTQGKISALQTQPGEAERIRFAVAAWNDTLAILQKAYADLLIEIKTTSPELADAVSVEPLPLAEVQKMLADSVALVEYFFAKDRLVSWVIDRAQARAVSLPLDRARLGESIVQFRRAIQKRASTEVFSRELYDVLIKPVAPLLLQTKQLLIVPHGALHYVPFPALQKADSTYLLDDYALAIAPSATVLGFCYRKGDALPAPSGEGYRVLALGNPDVGNPRLDLPFAEKEIKSLEQTFGEMQSFTRKQATYQALLAAKDNAELLHFSCHGVYDEKHPLFSALLLAPENELDDGRLAVHEIFNLKLNTRLVMLSACETGLARVTGGDEVVGLARGFIFAGTPSLIASLWTVDDLATAITVKRFYRYLKAGASKVEALRAAQRFVRDHHNRHPAYWASFGLTGDWR